MDVLLLLAEGLNNQDIGARLHISVATVKNRLLFLYLVFGVNDRLQLVIKAHREEILTLGRGQAQPFMQIGAMEEGAAR